MNAPTSDENSRAILVERPVGEVTPDCFRIETVACDPLDSGQVRVAVEHISVDAGHRTMLQGEGFHMQVQPGQVMAASGVGRVTESSDSAFAVGQAVAGRLGVQTLAAVSASSLRAIDDTHGPLRNHLGALGHSTGVTAWIGINQVARPDDGDVFVVSAAAGAVGSVAGQLARARGARVIGIAGGPEKTTHLVEVLGFDSAIDYKNDDVNIRLAELAPDGVNGFFDNVGGDILDAVLDNLALRARVTICGAISQYDDMANVVGPSLYLRLAERQSRMEGYAYFHFPELIEPALTDLAGRLADGSLIMTETILEGIERYPEALQFLFRGGNLGKLMVQLG